MSFDSGHLRLTDFMDLPTLQEIQDSFAAVANVRATITDADGNVLTQPQPTTEFLRRQRVIAQVEDGDGVGDFSDGPQKAGREYVAPHRRKQSAARHLAHEPQRLARQHRRNPTDIPFPKIRPRSQADAIARDVADALAQHPPGGNSIPSSSRQRDHPALFQRIRIASAHRRTRSRLQRPR